MAATEAKEWAVLTVDRKKVGTDSPLNQEGAAASTRVDNKVYFVKTDDLPPEEPTRTALETIGLYVQTAISVLRKNGTPHKEPEIPVVEYSVISGNLEPRTVRIKDLKRGGEIYRSHPSLKAVREDLQRFEADKI